MTQSYSGPLPPPEMFAKFDEVVPGSAKQIIDQFIKQGDHRMHLEKIVIEADVERSRWGLILGFVLALVIVLGSFYMIYLGKELIGSAGLLLAIGSLVGTFVYGTRSRRQEREAKEQMRQDTRKD